MLPISKRLWIADDNKCGLVYMLVLRTFQILFRPLRWSGKTFLIISFIRQFYFWQEME